MRGHIFGLCSLGLLITTPGVALAQAGSGHPAALIVNETVLASAATAVLSQRSDVDRDRLWNGMLIGGAIGAVVGMFVLPQAYCGAQDTECSVIVRIMMGAPAIAGGVGLGALVDKLAYHDGRPVPLSGKRGLQLRVRF